MYNKRVSKMLGQKSCVMRMECASALRRSLRRSFPIRQAANDVQDDGYAVVSRNLICHFYSLDAFIAQVTDPLTPRISMGAIRDLWVKWKMLKLPWRKTFLVGVLYSLSSFATGSWERSASNYILILCRPGSIWKHLLGIQGQAERQPPPSHCPLQNQCPLCRHQDLPSMASMVEAYSLRDTIHTRAASRPGQASAIEISGSAGR